MSKRFVIAILLVLSIVAVGSAWISRTTQAAPQPVVPSATGSYFQMGSGMGSLDESHPAPNIYDYAWATGKARFKIVPGSLTPSTPALVVGSESYLQTNLPVTESHPAADTVCYTWSSGSACFKVAPNTGQPSLIHP